MFSSSVCTTARAPSSGLNCSIPRCIWVWTLPFTRGVMSSTTTPLDAAWRIDSSPDGAWISRTQPPFVRSWPSTMLHRSISSSTTPLTSINRRRRASKSCSHSYARVGCTSSRTGHGNTGLRTTRRHIPGRFKSHLPDSRRNGRGNRDRSGDHLARRRARRSPRGSPWRSPDQPAVFAGSRDTTPRWTTHLGASDSFRSPPGRRGSTQARPPVSTR